MSRIIDVSPKLGQYMLRGWVLTDNICTTCRSIPKMRSPNGTSPVVELCVNCDDDTPKTQERAPNRDESITSSDATSLNMSRTSTPPTEISSTLSSPTFALPADTEESLRRRRQSDMASTEIGNRLLKGWAMLGDECPRETCFGIPLVRPPKPGGGKDPRKECVVCGTIYVHERDASGWDNLVATPASAPQSSSTRRLERPATRGVPVDETPMRVEHNPPSTSINPSQHAFSRGTEFDHQAASVTAKYEPRLNPESTTIVALEASARSLELTLHALSERLRSLAGGQITVDPTSISQTAEAISKVSLALTQVKQLQWSEKEARASH